MPYYADDKNVFCVNCFYYFCNLCLKNVENCNCGENEVFDVNGLSTCPGCRSLYAKDENCCNVKCEKEGCLAEFCFMCSAFKGPISAHGCHYHRPQCKFYKSYEGSDVEYKDSCFACVKEGKLCTPPGDLRKNRIIADDEF